MSNARSSVEDLAARIAEQLIVIANAGETYDAQSSPDLKLYAHEIVKNLEILLYRAATEGIDVTKELTLLRAQAKLLAVRNLLRISDSVADLLADIVTFAAKIAIEALRK